MADELLELIARTLAGDGPPEDEAAEAILDMLRANSALVLKEVGIHAGWSQPGKYLGEYVYALDEDSYDLDRPENCVPLYAAIEPKLSFEEIHKDCSSDPCSDCEA